MAQASHPEEHAGDDDSSDVIDLRDASDDARAARTDVAAALEEINQFAAVAKASAVEGPRDAPTTVVTGDHAEEIRRIAIEARERRAALAQTDQEAVGREPLEDVAVGGAEATVAGIVASDIRESDIRESDIRESDIRESDIRESDSAESEAADPDAVGPDTVDPDIVDREIVDLVGADQVGDEADREVAAFSATAAIDAPDEARVEVPGFTRPDPDDDSEAGPVVFERVPPSMIQRPKGRAPRRGLLQSIRFAIRQLLPTRRSSEA